MAGFQWDAFYEAFRSKLEKAVPCTVGRYTVPDKSSFPYVDIALIGNEGGNYDLSGQEGSQNPLLAVTVYAAGTLADSACEEISRNAKELMLSYGFQCRSGPMKTASTAGEDSSCWLGKYQRIVGSSDELV